MKIDTIFMNSENSKTSEPHVLILNLTDKLDSNSVSNISIYYTWKTWKANAITISLKISALTWNYNLNHLMDHILYQIFRNILSISKKSMQKILVNHQ